MRASPPVSIAARGVERHQARRLDLGRRLGDVALDLALLGQQRAVRVAGVGAVAHQLEGALRLAQPAHAVEDPAGAEPLLRDHEAVAARPSRLVCGHAHVVSRRISQWPPPVWPMVGTTRTIS